MKLHWHWGTKLMIFMAMFMLLLIGFVYMSFQENFDLVEKDYYPKSLDFQVEIDKMDNAKEIGELISVENDGKGLQIKFPRAFNFNEVSGHLYFYRPSDKRDDQVIEIKLDSMNQQYIQTASFSKGKYTLKMDYTVGKRDYLQEETVFINMN